MSDNVELNPGSGGAQMATDDIGGIQHQRVKVVLGADGVSDGDVSSANPLPVSDAGGSITVDGTVTANLGTVDNAVLDAIQAAVEAIQTAVETLDNVVAGSEAQVDVVSSALPSGASTAANQATGNTALAAIQAAVEGTLSVAAHAVTNAGTFAVQEDGAALTALQLIDDAVYVDDADWSDGVSKHLLVGGLYQSTPQTITDGDVGPFQVDSNGNLKVNVAAGAAGGVSHVDDAAFTPASDDVVPAAGMFDDTTPDSVDEGDAGILRMSARRELYVQIRDAAGNERGLNIDASGNITESNSDQIVTELQNIDSSIGSVQTRSIDETHVDDAAFTPGTSKVFPIGAAFDDTTPDSVDEGDSGIVRMSANRNLYITIRDAAGNERGVNIDASNQLAVADAAVAALLGTIDADTSALAGTVGGSELQVDVVGALPAGTNAIGKLAANSGVDIGDVDVTSIVPGTGASNLGKAEDAAHASADVGVMALAVRTGTPANRSGTDGDYEPLQISAGRLWTSGVITSLPASTNTLEVVGDVAHDAAVAGNPVQIAGAAQNMDDTAPPNRISTEGDAVRLAMDFDGAVFAHPHGPQAWKYHANGSTALTDDTVHAAPGAGLSVYITDIVFSSGAATAINLILEEATTTIFGPLYLEAVAGRGVAVHFVVPLKVTANTAVTVTTSASIAHSVHIHGYIGQG